MVFGLRPLCSKQVFSIPYIKFEYNLNTELKNSHKKMTISKIERSHESSRHEHLRLLLKFLAQLPFKLNRFKCCTAVHRKYLEICYDSMNRIVKKELIPTTPLNYGVYNQSKLTVIQSLRFDQFVVSSIYSNEASSFLK